MRIKDLTLGILGLGFAATSFGAMGAQVSPDFFADNTMHACNSCSNAQTSALAIRLGRGDHYIYDLTANHLHLFSVECEPGAGVTQCFAEEGSPAADAQAFFNEYYAAYTQIRPPVGEAFAVSQNYDAPSALVGPDGNPTDNGEVNAFDTVYSSAIDNTLRDHLMSPHSYSGALATFISTLANGVGYSVPNLNIVVTVRFADGSLRKYTFKQDENQFVPIPSSAIDSNGNVLPDNGRPARPQNFLFDSSRSPNGTNVRNIATLLAVSPPELVEYVLQCTWDGQHLTCRHAK